MKALFDGLDYHLILDSAKRELNRLLMTTPKKARITAALRDFHSRKELGPRVSLELGDTNHADGIELTLIPENARNNEEIEKVRVVIDQQAYDILCRTGFAVSTYLHTENKVRLVYRRSSP